MKVVILAGGRGTRLSEETHAIPKPMVRIGGRPMVWHIMSHYAAFGFTDFVLALGLQGLRDQGVLRQLPGSPIGLHRPPADRFGAVHLESRPEDWNVSLSTRAWTR